MFDISTKTKGDLQKYTKFRKKLLENGFYMWQFSIYVRFCKSLAIAKKYEKKVELFAPLNGSIQILRVTEAQYKQIVSIQKLEKNEKLDSDKQFQSIIEF